MSDNLIIRLVIYIYRFSLVVNTGTILISNIIDYAEILDLSILGKIQYHKARYTFEMTNLLEKLGSFVLLINTQMNRIFQSTPGFTTGMRNIIILFYQH